MLRPVNCETKRRDLQGRSDIWIQWKRVAVREDGASSRESSLSEVRMGRFALGFIVALIVVIFIVVQCAQALF